MEIDLLFRDAVSERIGRRKFEMWFSSQVHFDVQPDRILLSVPNEFFGKWIRDHYRHVILQVSRQLLGKDYSLDVHVTGASPASPLSLNPATPLLSPTEESSLSTGTSEKDSETFAVSMTASSINMESEPVDQREAPSLSPASSSSPATFQNPQFINPLAEAGKKSLASLPERMEPSTGRSPRGPVPRNNEKKVVEGLDKKIPKSPVPARSTRGAHPSGRSFASYDSFVEGMSNQLAHRVADIALTQPGTINPIFFYGPTSVGKTHLLEGIYSEFRKRKGNAPKFMTAEEFTTLFIQGFRSGKEENRGFRYRFNDLSLLIIDDIHFFKGKEATQMELIHLIDQLRRRGVQMIFSADRPLPELSCLKSELVTRIESGIVCGINPPERETLLKIFQQMATQRGLSIPDDVCRFVVSRFTTHARQLSGALNRLHASHLATGRAYTVEMASDVLSDMFRGNQRSIRLEDIEKAISEIFDLAPESLRGPSRARQFSQPRMLAMWLARKYTRSALSEIGRYFGNRSHSTVVSAQKRVDAWLQEEERSTVSPADHSLSETLHRAERLLTREV